MNKILKVVIVQYDVVWHCVQENLVKIESLLNTIPGPADLILLPEMFATGFTMQPENISEQDNKAVIEWMHVTSRKYNCAIAGTHPIKINDRFYNRLLFYSETEKIDTFYDKRHLFTMGDENIHYMQGVARNVIPFMGWRIMPMICYDLRFPVWSRNDISYDLLFYSSNWPASRNDVWETLLKARAIENQSFVIGVNRIGTDGMKIPYIGNTQVLSPKGRTINKLGNEQAILYAELDKEKLIEFRTKFPVLRDGDQFNIK